MLSTYYVPNPDLAFEDKASKKTKIPVLTEVTFKAVSEQVKHVVSQAMIKATETEYAGGTRVGIGRLVGTYSVK